MMQRKVTMSEVALALAYREEQARFVAGHDAACHAGLALAAVLGICVAALPAVAGEISNAPAARTPSTAPGEVDVHALLDGRTLVLSRLGSSKFDSYSFVVEVSLVRDGQIVKAFDMIVARRKERAAILIRFSDGLPYSYIKDGLAVFFDEANGGQLLVLKAGRPALILRRQENRLDFIAASRKEDRDAEFIFDARSLIDYPARGRVSYDLATSTLRIVGPTSTVLAEVPSTAQTDAFGLDRWTVISNEGRILSVRNIQSQIR